MTEKVSIITPTFRREAFLPLAHAAVLAQTYAEWEWLVLDDSPQPSAHMAAVNDPRIRYRHTSERLTIGRKRNELVAESTGSVIVHFDDDDYYGPSYVERMVRRLGGGCEFVKLSGWYVYAVGYRALGYWDLNRKTGWHHVWSPPHPPGNYRFTTGDQAAFANNHLGYGFSYVYRRELWARQPFADDAHWNEDAPFALAAQKSERLTHFRDIRGICLHVLHVSNTSKCFPQYVLPSFVLRLLFPAAVGDYVAH